MKAKLQLEVTFESTHTSAEDVAKALDKLLTTALRTYAELDEVGNPSVGRFEVVHTERTADDAPPRPWEFDNLGSLITFKDTDKCLGALVHFQGHGVYDAHYGKVEIAPEYVDPHNAALDNALLLGLDSSCQVGQCGSFYYDEDNGVRTFTGVEVSKDLERRGRTITFRRKGMTFVGRLAKSADGEINDLLNFERIS